MSEEDPARARRYKGLFDGSNEAEVIFLTVLPTVTMYINDKLRARGHKFDVSQAEVAINFIAEGGYFALDQNLVSGLDGFCHLGVDNYIGNREVYRRWVPKSVDEIASKSAEDYTNEKGEETVTFSDINLEDGLYASAGAFAWAIACASKDIDGFAKLPRNARFFWGTIYFNAGVGTGRRLYKKFGVDYYKEGWSGTFNNRSARFNATWRMRSMELISRQIPSLVE